MVVHNSFSEYMKSKILEILESLECLQSLGHAYRYPCTRQLHVSPLHLQLWCGIPAAWQDLQEEQVSAGARAQAKICSLDDVRRLTFGK